MDHGQKGRKQLVFDDPSAWLAKKGKHVEVDCHSIRWLGRHTRTAIPAKVIWNCKTRCERSGKEGGFWPTGERGNLHYWLGLDRYDKDVELDAERIVVETEQGSNLIEVKEIGNFVRFYLSPEMFDLGKEIKVRVKGETLTARPRLSLGVVLRTLLDRGDPNYMFPAYLTLSRNPEGDWMLE
jgi:hypothetical protein